MHFSAILVVTATAHKGYVHTIYAYDIQCLLWYMIYNIELYSDLYDGEGCCQFLVQGALVEGLRKNRRQIVDVTHTYDDCGLVLI